MFCRYISNAEFDPSTVRNAAKACEGLVKWVRALDIYDRVAKVVAPKKASLAEAEAELSVQMVKLNEKRGELQEVSHGSGFSLLKACELSSWYD